MLTKEETKELKTAARTLERARAKEAEAWEDAKAVMTRIHQRAAGQTSRNRPTFQDIAEVFGITKARVYQVVTGNRGGSRPAQLVDDREPVSA